MAATVAVLKRSVALAPLLAVSLGVAPPASAAAGTWTPTGSMTMPRAYHTATLLNSGQVLAAGGNNPHPFGGAYASAERYDPASGTWSPTQSMAIGRTRHTATLLDDGRVLVAGGVIQDATRAELYVSVPASGPTHVTSAAAAAPAPGPAGSIRPVVARYDRSQKVLRVAATRTSRPATLTVSVTSTGQVIGTLTHASGKTYRGTFAWPADPGSITIRSSLGGAITVRVTAR